MSDRLFRDAEEKLSFVVIPYAGGSSHSFSEWRKELGEVVDFKVVDYAGHGNRIGESLIRDFDLVVTDIADKLVNQMDKKTVLFGHSMGGLVGAYAASEIYQKVGKKFERIIISCCMAPEHFNNRGNYMGNDRELLFYLETERAIPTDVIYSKEFMKFIFPAIKNDFNILRKFSYKSLQIPSCPIHCICAENDYVKRELMSGWQKHTSVGIKWHKIKGSHFYFEEYPQKTFNLIKKILNSKEVHNDER